MQLSDNSNEIIFIGLNPSMSDQSTTDNTTKKIIKICANLNYDRIKIINLFALISRSPKLLNQHPEPVGYLNDEIINENLRYWSKNENCHLWLGWGNLGNLKNRNLYLRYSKKNTF